MAFVGTFSPIMLPERLGQPVKSSASFLRKVSSPTSSTVSSPHSRVSSPPLISKGGVPCELSHFDLGPSYLEQDTAEHETVQFAPLLQLRRKQVTEGTEACESAIEDLLSDAFETMIALEEASRSIDALYEEVLGGSACRDFLGAGDSESGFGELGELDLRIEEADVTVLSPRLLVTMAEIHAVQADSGLSDIRCGSSMGIGETIRQFSQEDKPSCDRILPMVAECGTSRSSTAPPFRDKEIHRYNEQRSGTVEVSEQGFFSLATGAIEQATTATRRGSQVVDLVAEAGWSVAEGFLSMATGAFERATSPITEGRETATHCVEGLLRVDGDLAMDAMMLRETLRVLLYRLLQPLAQVRSVTLTLPPERSTSVVSTAGAGPTSGCSFAYRISVADPHDLEPLRETLLLEAESGGARSLLPLLTDQLCEEGHALPRHLKVRLEVQSGL